MIHYHGTPVSGPGDSAVRFLTGRHALVSYAVPESIGLVAEVCQSFVLDNGAFSAWRRGHEPDWDAYAAWVDDWRRYPGFDWALCPDVIDGSEADNDALLRDYPGMVPIWHLHESLGRLERLASLYRWVALGSSGQWPTPGAAGWWGRMREAMRVVCDAEGRPACKLHGLRMLDPEIFRHLPFASADSANAGVNAGSVRRFGSYVPPTAGQRAEVIAARIEAHNSAPVWRDTQGEIDLCFGS